MEQVGVVTQVRDSYAELAVKRVSACGENCKGCSASCDIEPHTISVPDTLNVRVGDYVELRSDSRKVLKYIFMIYGIPFVFLMVGIFLGSYLLKSYNVGQYEVFSVVIGIVMLLIGLGIVSAIDKRFDKKNEIIEMVKIIEDE